MGDRGVLVWTLLVVACMVLVLGVAVYDLVYGLENDVSMYRMQIEGLTPALEVCEEDVSHWKKRANNTSLAITEIAVENTAIKDGASEARLRITTGYELLNALTSTMDGSGTTGRYQDILDNIELIDDPTLDNMMDEWMLNADENESMLLLLEVIKYLMLDAEFHLLPR